MTTEYLLAKEVDYVLAALTPSNQLIMRVCLHTGLRLGDVLALRTADLRRQFWIEEAKTKKRRRVNLPGVLLDEIKKQAGREWAFPGRKPGTHKTRQAVWADVKRAARAFRLRQNVAPHSARKVYAVNLLHSSGGDLKKVQRALNHGSLTTTMVYAMAAELLEAKRRKKGIASKLA